MKKILLLVSFTSNCFAIQVDDFDIKLTENQFPHNFREKLQSVVEKPNNIWQAQNYLDTAVLIFRKYWAMHLMELRNKKKSDLLRWDNLHYAETILNVIPTELARAIFNINSQKFQYNTINDKILEIKGCNPDMFNATHWNYVVLINVIDKALNSEIKTIAQAKKKKNYCDDYIVFDRDKKVWMGEVIKKTIDDMTQTYGQKYESNILKAKHDILYYFNELELNKILYNIRTVRLYLVSESTDQNSWSDKLDTVMKDANSITAYMNYLPKINIRTENIRVPYYSEALNKDTGQWVEMDINAHGEKFDCLLFNVKFSMDIKFSKNTPIVSGLIKDEYFVLNEVKLNSCFGYIPYPNIFEMDVNFYEIRKEIQKYKDKEYDDQFLICPYCSSKRCPGIRKGYNEIFQIIEHLGEFCDRKKIKET